MKKKVFGGLVIAAIAAVATLNVNVNNSEETTAINLANVEALAQGEGNGSFYNCLGWGTPCPWGSYGQTERFSWVDF